VAEKVSFN